MDWSLIIYGAIGGGLGSLLGALLAGGLQKMRAKPQGSQTDNKGFQTDNKGSESDEKSSSGTRQGISGGLAGGLAVAGMLLLPALYKNMTLPRLTPLDHNEIFDQTPIYKIIEQQSPEDFRRLIVPVDRAVRNGDVTQSDLDEMRVVLFKLINEKKSVASADTLREIEGISQAQAGMLKTEDPKICTLMINGEPYPSLVEIFGEDQVTAEGKATENLFIAPPRDPNFKPDLKRGQSLFSTIASEASAENGALNLHPEITGSVQNDAEHRKVCDFIISYSEKKSALGDDDLLNLAAYEGSL